MTSRHRRRSTDLRRPLRALVVTAAAALAVLATAPAASAHAGLESSDPSSGEILPTSPSEITITFTEPPDLDLSTIELLGADGARIDTGPVERTSAPRSIGVTLRDPLADGVYTVSWVVVSTADSHPTTGVFAFGVGTTSGAIEPSADEPASATPPPTPSAVVGKVLLYAGLAIAVGTAATGLFAFGGTVPARRWLLPGAGAAATLGAIAMTLAEARLLSVSIGDLLSSATGRSYVWLLGTTAVTLIAAIIAGRSTGTPPLVATGLAAAAAMWVRAASGHASALVPPLPAEVAQLVHFIAIGVWIGGLVPLFALVLTRRRDDAPPPVEQVRAFSRLAGWALLVVVVTGVARSVGEAGGFGSVATMLTETTYGTTLIVKVILALGLIGLGALNRRRSIPRLATDGTMLRQIVTIELVAALGVLGLTGTLTSLNPNPPADEGAAPEVESATATGADFATTTRVTFTATPGTAGPNAFEARIVDFDDGSPVDADEVTVLMAPIGRAEIAPTTLPLEPGATGDGGAPLTWVANGTQLSLAGAWDLTVQVRSAARTTEVPLVLITRAPPTTSVVAQGADDLPDIETFTLSTGDQLQLYLDPGRTGANEYHVTAFDPSGSELPLTGLVVAATDPDGATQVLDVTRLTPGHFGAPLDAAGGRWTFDVVATSEGGTVLQATQVLEVGT